jgi:hypothetical protein
MAAMAGSISGASCALYSMPSPQCFFKHPVSFTAPPFICFGAAMQGHMVHTAMFVPHITPVRTICPAAPVEFLLLGFTTSGGMFFMA